MDSVGIDGVVAEVVRETPEGMVGVEDAVAADSANACSNCP